MSTRWKTVLICCVAAGSFLAGSWYSRKSGSQQPAPGARRILFYVDPMHPSYKSDRPGVAPDCGMQLEPVYADSGKSRDRSEPAPNGAVQIAPEKQQVIGVRSEEAARSSGSHTLRVLGRVTLDETRVIRVAAAVDGWVRTAGPIATGSIVAKDEVLATFYNRDFLTAQQTYLYALNTMDRFKDKESEDQLKLTRAQMQAAEENLEFLGMGEAQVREVARTRQIARNIELRSPVAGLVLARNAFPGLRFERGTELFRIAELNHVWVLADLFEHESGMIQPGQQATLRYRGKTFHAKMSQALPQFDPATRTLKVRFELDNPGYVLRPDMFVDVELPVRLPAAITVPADAMIDSGVTKTVYVDRGNGWFEPRAVEVLWRYGDRVGIAKGLEAGERVVVSGNFLLDSESRMRLGATQGKAGAKPTDPVCLMEVAPAQAEKAEHAGTTYYFCSPNCRRAFERDPRKYLRNKA